MIEQETVRGFQIKLSTRRRPAKRSQLSQPFKPRIHNAGASVAAEGVFAWEITILVKLSVIEDGQNGEDLNKCPF